MYNVTRTDGPDPRDLRTLDWTEHRARAVIGFEFDTDPAWLGVPVNPIEPWLPAGLGELWHGGEANAADAIVTNRDATGHRELLIIERDDNHGYAVPGGGLDAGEDPLTAAVRELGEETRLFLSPSAFVAHRPRYAPDPRAARHAWWITHPHTAELHMQTPPAVVGTDDARRALWLPADSYAELENAVKARGGAIFAAHQAMLRDLL